MQKNPTKTKQNKSLVVDHTTSIAENILGCVSGLKETIKENNVEVKLNGNTASIRVSGEEKTYIITYREEKNYKKITQSQTDTPLEKGERILFAKKLYSEGKTQAEIAKMVGCSQKTISNDLKK